MGIRCRSEVRCNENNIFVLNSVCVLSKISGFDVFITNTVCDEENLRFEFDRACFVRAFSCAYESLHNWNVRTKFDVRETRCWLLFYTFDMFVTCDFVLRSVLPIWFAASYFRNGGYGRIVIAICTLISKYFDYSHVTSQPRGTGGFSPETLPIVIVIE